MTYNKKKKYESFTTQTSLEKYYLKSAGRVPEHPDPIKASNHLNEKLLSKLRQKKVSLPSKIAHVTLFANTKPFFAVKIKKITMSNDLLGLGPRQLLGAWF